MIFRITLLIWIAAVLTAAIFYLPPAQGFADPGAARLIIFHVPNAMVAVVAFLVSLVFALRYLNRKSPIDDIKSAVSARLGLMFTVLATVTGSIFARLEWNSWWNWDPRETSIVLLLIVYAAYFALRSAVESDEKRGKLSAVYAILACPAMLFLVFVMPRIMPSLHPSQAHLGPEYRIVLFAGMLGCLGVYLWLFSSKTRKEIKK